MAITFPYSLPSSPGYRSRELAPQTVVDFNRSPFTGAQQVYAWPGQWLQFVMELPPMRDADAGAWSAAFMALNGPAGTFLLGDSVRKNSRGTIAGTWTVGAGAVANTTTLPLSGGTGVFVAGDWLQVFSGASSRLHRVLKVNMVGANMTSVEVFPRLRSAYANGSVITYTGAKGLFRLAAIPAEAFDSRKICGGMSFTAIEALSSS